MNYFTRLCKNYFSVLFYKVNEGDLSIWSYLESVFANNVYQTYPQFVEEVFKSFLDENQIVNAQVKRDLYAPSIEMSELSHFLINFLKIYSL